MLDQSTPRTALLLKIEIVVLAIFIGYLFFFDKIIPSQTQLKVKIMVPIVQTPQVLGESTITTVPTPTPSPIPLPTEALARVITPTDIITKKKSYVIAVYGDSMIDTMGEKMEYLERTLKKKYPKTEFKLYNYGIGSQNVQQGIARLNDDFNYQTRHYPSITSLKPDIIILGSFAYNPYFPYDREKYEKGLKQLINLAKKTTSNVYLIAEIAPLKRDFGKGENGVNWPEIQTYEHATQIISNLETAINVALNLQIPVINVFSQSQTNLEKEGNKKYVSTNDGIHPSIEGQKFTAGEIANIIILN